MRFLLLEPAHDWTDQVVEERASDCAVLLCLLGLISEATKDEVLTRIQARADRQRRLRDSVTPQFGQAPIQMLAHDRSPSSISNGTASASPRGDLAAGYQTERGPPPCQS